MAIGIMGVGHNLGPSTFSQQSQEKYRKISWLLLPAFNYGWDTLRMDA
jgi:hypothetical protein